MARLCLLLAPSSCMQLKTERHRNESNSSCSCLSERTVSRQPQAGPRLTFKAGWCSGLDVADQGLCCADPEQWPGSCSCSCGGGCLLGEVGWGSTCLGTGVACSGLPPCGLPTKSMVPTG